MKSPFKPRNLTQNTFDDTDMQRLSDIHHDSLVITMQIGTVRVLRILVDGGSSVNLIMLDILKAMKIDEKQIIKKPNVLVGFSGETKNTLGEIYLPSYVEGVSSYERFGVLDCHSSYNAILGRPCIHNVRAIPSTYPEKEKVCRKRRKFAPERNTIINEEVDKLLDMGMIREVMYPEWLANVVVVQKKNGKWRVCVDYTHLNKACPKDPFPLPHIDAMVDATAGHKILTFMDASSGFN
ncbi:uncharacterized protein LOC141631485 [Silene latifolia]|uniref:uncharacterized protein LOC141631485 n=1 Tax=Silene latifolia TaxID=37657 RepID=UPI003D786F86